MTKLAVNTHKIEKQETRERQREKGWGRWVAVTKQTEARAPTTPWVTANVHHTHAPYSSTHLVEQLSSITSGRQQEPFLPPSTFYWSSFPPSSATLTSSLSIVFLLPVLLKAPFFLYFLHLSAASSLTLPSPGLPVYCLPSSPFQPLPFLPPSPPPITSWSYLL